MPSQFTSIVLDLAVASATRLLAEPALSAQFGTKASDPRLPMAVAETFLGTLTQRARTREWCELDDAGRDRVIRKYLERNAR